MGDENLKYEDEEEKELDLTALVKLLEEKEVAHAALELDRESMVNVYRFVMRYITRYQKSVCRVLMTLKPAGEMNAADANFVGDSFETHICNSLRKSDLVFRHGRDQFFVMLIDIKEDSIYRVIESVVSEWKKKHPDINVNCELQYTYFG